MQQKLKADSAELAQLKKDAPMLFLGPADIDNRKTGRFVSNTMYDDGNMYTLMYKGRSNNGKLMFEATNEYDYEVNYPEFSMKSIFRQGLVPSPFDVGDKVTFFNDKDGPVGAIGTVMQVNFWRQAGHIHVKADQPYQLDRGSPWTGSTSYMKYFTFAE